MPIMRSKKHPSKMLADSSCVPGGGLIEREGKDYPSNAFAILTGNGGLHVATQCGVFKGTTKAVFVDRREYTGPLWGQIEEAFQFVLRNIHLGATIVGIYRQDKFETKK